MQGTPGADLVDDLEVAKADEVIEKGKDKRVEMYSVFYDPFKVSNSGTTDILKGGGITWVYVVGLALDYCVKASALDARKEGFEVVVIREGSRAVDGSEENVKRVEEELHSFGVRFVSKNDDEVRWLF